MDKQKDQKNMMIGFYTNGTIPDVEDEDDDISPNRKLAQLIMNASEKNQSKDAQESLYNLQCDLMESTFWGNIDYSERPICRDFIKVFCKDKKNHNKVAGVIEAIFNSINFNTYLTMLRKPWALTGGCGSQSNNEDGVSAHNKMVLKFIVQYKKELKKRYGE
jgi:hypothetical protein